MVTAAHVEAGRIILAFEENYVNGLRHLSLNESLVFELETPFQKKNLFLTMFLRDLL